MIFRRFTWIAALVAVLSVPIAGHAFEFLSTNEDTGSARVEAGQAIDDTVFGAGNTVDVRGMITRDAFLAGNTVTIDSQIGSNLFAAGETLTINSDIAHDAILAAGTIILGKEGRIGGDVLVLAERIQIDGTIDGSIRGAGSSLTVNGTVAEVVEFHGEQLNLGETALIQGDLRGNVTSSNAEERRSQVQGAVELTKSEPVKHDRSDALGTLFFMICAGMVGGLILFGGAPKLSDQIRTLAYAKPAQGLLVGLAATLLALPLFILLLIFVVTIPAGVVFACLFFAAMIVSHLFAALWTGDLLSRKRWPMYGSLLVGIIVLEILALIPLIGPFVKLCVAMLGFGALLTASWQWFQKSAR